MAYLHVFCLLVYNHTCMDDTVPVYRNPRWQAFFVVLLVALIYAWTMGRQQGSASDAVFFNERYAYLAMGQMSGLCVAELDRAALDLAETTWLLYFECYDTPGSARRLYLDGQYLYVADGGAGLQVFDAADPYDLHHVAALSFNADIQDVLVFGGYAYLAAGKNGLVVLDVTDPFNPNLIGQVDTPGIAQGLAIDQFYLDGLSAGTATDFASPIDFVYVADGPKGVQVVDLGNPREPAVVGSYDTPGIAYDLFVNYGFAYVADGNSGLRVIDVYDLGNLTQVGVYDPRGDVFDVWLDDGLAYLALDGGVHVLAVDEQNPANLELWGSVRNAGVGQSVVVYNNLALISSGVQGFQLLNVSDLANLRPLATLETPGEATLLDVLGILPRLLGLLPGRISDKSMTTLESMILDGCLCTVGMLLGLAFFAQFVLPVRRLGERLNAVDRLIRYWLGRHGPAIFIEDGQVRQSQKDRLARGPGVAVLDTASGAVFRNAHAFTRPHGPGVVFTSRGEFLAGQVDLHRQVKYIGPRDNEDVFAPRQERESEEEYRARQERRNITSALTRDGVEVVPNVLTVFKIDADQGESGTQFGYRDHSVWRAIAHEGIRPEASELQERRVAWDWLPVYMAVDLWREYLRKYTLNELFGFPSSDPDAPSDGQPKLPLVIRMVGRRLTQAHVDRYDEKGRPVYKKDAAGNPTKEIEQIASHEFTQLQQRGIRVFAANIRNLRFPEPVERRLVEQWGATWLDRAMDELRDAERMQSEKRIEGEREANLNFVLGAVQFLSERLQTTSSDQLSLSETIELLVRGTLDTCLRDADLRGQLGNEKSGLSELIGWIQRNNGKT